MTPGDIAFAQACVRGFHTALAAFKAWAETQAQSPEDERLIHALDYTAEALKQWVRAKAAQLSRKEITDESQQQSPGAAGTPLLP